MAQRIEEIMTPNPTTIPASATLVAAARAMRDHDIGDVVVLEDSKPCGILTDRDVVVRAVATGKDPSTTTIAEICSRDVTTVSPKDTVDTAVALMAQKALRRLPVVDDDLVIGIVTIGDLAGYDVDSAIADISAAPPNR